MRILKTISVLAAGAFASFSLATMAHAQGNAPAGGQGQAGQGQAGQGQAGQGQAGQGQAGQGQAGQGQAGQGQAGQQGQAGLQGGYNGISQSPWFSNPAMRQQLQLNEEQYNRLNNAYSQSFNRYNQGLSSMDRNLNETQRAQRLQELNRGFSNEFSKSTDGLFTDDAARQRFNQYQWQYQGYGAFSDPSIQKQLNLTDEQLQRLNTYNSEWNNQMGTWRNEYQKDRDGTSNSFREARREAQNRINSLLTPEQRRSWNDLIGKPVDWPADVYFPNPVTSGSTDRQSSNSTDRQDSKQ